MMRVQASELRQADQIAKMAIREYAAVPEVQAIYQENGANGITFWVFTSNKSYHDQLMDILLDHEEVILDKYPETVVLFRYIPSVLTTDPREATGQAATLLFQR